MKGVLIITIIWILICTAVFTFLDLGAATISTYGCMAIVWFCRKKLIKALKI